MTAFAIVVTSLGDAQTTAVYLVGGTCQPTDVARLTSELLCDPVIQHATWYDLAHQTLDVVTEPSYEVAFRAGVTDNEAESILTGAQRLGITGVTSVRTLRRYAAPHNTPPAYNDLIQTCHAVTADNTDTCRAWYVQHLAEPSQRAATIAVVPIRTLDDDALVALSQTGLLALDLAEMRTIQAYYRDIGRDPSDGEIETIAQTWSEHCSHKTFKGRVQYTGAPHDLTDAQQPHHPGLVALGTHADIDSLIRTYLMKATNQTAPRLAHLKLISAFVDNAGIVAFDDELELSFKVETHNHPSALEPFGGANTGLGGVLRDVLGVSAQPIAATDVFCFGPRDADLASMGGHVLPTHQVALGVVAGVQDYGNKIGVPIVNGAVFFDPGYVANPLVFAGTVGLAPQGKHPRHVGVGDAIVVLGGRTGRDGIHGATFSSIELTHTTAQEAGSAVQIGDPITEKLIDVVLQARDAGLYSAITDCGAGGLSSAIGEMGEQTGARVELAQVPRKYAGLQPWEVWLSEAQERIVMAVPPHHLATLLALCDAEEVEATAIGTYDGSGRLVVTHHGTTLVDIDMHMLHDGRPQRTLTATWQAGTSEPPAWRAMHHNQIIAALLAHPNIASRAPIIRGYDHEVQGRTVVKPLVGAHSDGHGDAAVLQVRPDTTTGVAIGCGMAPQLSQFDPYWMGLAAIDEALRNVVAVGADPSACVVLDNFCWGDPRQPDRMGGLTRATVSCYDAALAYGTPFISGKDSLNNEYRSAHGQRIPIPGTLLISAMAYHPDIRQAQTSDFKQSGNAIYVVGMTQNAFAGAHVALVAGIPAVAQWRQPRVDLAVAPRLMHQLHTAIQRGCVVACHDVSDGGLAVAVTEMAVAGRLGADIDLDLVPSETTDPFVVLYSESPSRFVVEVPVARQAEFVAALAGIAHACIGHVRATSHVTATSGGQVCMQVAVSDLVTQFQTAIL